MVECSRRRPHSGSVGEPRPAGKSRPERACGDSTAACPTITPCHHGVRSAVDETQSRPATFADARRCSIAASFSVMPASAAASCRSQAHFDCAAHASQVAATELSAGACCDPARHAAQTYEDPALGPQALGARAMDSVGNHPSTWLSISLSRHCLQ